MEKNGEASNIASHRWSITFQQRGPGNSVREGVAFPANGARMAGRLYEKKKKMNRKHYLTSYLLRVRLKCVYYCYVNYTSIKLKILRAVYF